MYIRRRWTGGVFWGVDEIGEVDKLGGVDKLGKGGGLGGEG